MNVGQFASEVLDEAITKPMHHVIIFDVNTGEKEEKNLADANLLSHALYHYKRGDAIKINDKIFTTIKNK